MEDEEQDENNRNNWRRGWLLTVGHHTVVNTHCLCVVKTAFCTSLPPPIILILTEKMALLPAELSMSHDGQWSRALNSQLHDSKTWIQMQQRACTEIAFIVLK